LSATTARPPATRPAPDFAALRAREFPYVTGAPYLNAASVAPVPERARRAVEAYNRLRGDPGAFRGEHFEPVLARCREAAARLIGAGADEIALLPNTSFGINLAAQGLPLEPGRRVLLSDREFPANVYPWMALGRQTGARVDVVPADGRGHPDEDRLLEEVARGDVGVLALSAVQFTDGWRAELARFGRACREHGTFFVVDAIQALGHTPLDVREAQVDVLATGGQKWLCSPFGTGFTYVRQSLQEWLEPRTIGWTAMTASADFADVLGYRWEMLDDARRYEVATQPFQDYAGMAESLALLAEAGPDCILAHATGLLDPLVAWLAERGIPVASDLRPERRSGILAFRPADPGGCWRALARAGVGCVVREGAVRLSPHLYNTADDLARVIEVLETEEAL
jgi:cysteine desulfurase / selenocysteine lyase